MHNHSRRHILCTSVALALASAPLTGQAQDAPTKKECSNLVSEYVRPSTPIGRKAQTDAARAT
jgi:hypothetical protein